MKKVRVLALTLLLSAANAAAEPPDIPYQKFVLGNGLTLIVHEDHGQEHALGEELAEDALSGGEGQRIRLASQIGSQLTGVIYVLDEPSIGLHQRDNKKLLAVLKHLRDIGNTARSAWAGAGSREGKRRPLDLPATGVILP